MQQRTVQGRAALAAAALTLAAGAAGCQSYEPRPLDLDAHAEAWRERMPNDEPVRAFAERLDAARQQASAFDVADGLSVHEAELVSLVYNPELRLARLRAGVAMATAEHAGLWADPELSVDVLRIAEGVPDPWVVGTSLSLTIPISGRLEAEKAEADAAARARLDAVAEAEWQTRADLREAWARWSATTLRLEETQQLIESLESVLSSAERLSEAGELMRTEAALFAIELATRRNDLTQLQGELAEAEQDIRRPMGLSPDADVRLIASIPSPALPSDPENRLVEVSPELARLRTEYEVAEQHLRREIRKQYPDLMIGPQYESDEGQSRIGFVGAIPIPLLNANRQGIAEAEAERELSRAAYETAYEQAVGEMAGLLARAKAARTQRQELEQTLVPMVDRQVDDARRLIELGEIPSRSAVVLLESLTRAHETKLRLIDLRLTESLAAIAIRRLIGPEHPLPPVAPRPAAIPTPDNADLPASPDASEVIR